MVGRLHAGGAAGAGRAREVAGRLRGKLDSDVGISTTKCHGTFTSMMMIMLRAGERGNERGQHEDSRPTSLVNNKKDDSKDSQNK